MDKLLKLNKKTKQHQQQHDYYQEQQYENEYNLLNQNDNNQNINIKKELNLNEKKYLLAVERGDLSTVKEYLERAREQDVLININCIDPVGRSALLIAIEYENIEMIELLLNNHIQLGEALLHAINEQFVEAVEILLNYIDQHKYNQQLNTFNDFNTHNTHSLFSHAATALKKQQQQQQENKVHTEKILQNQSSKSFTPDITPIILAAHKNNYEIIKILLDRGEKIPEPHDVRCSCATCVRARRDDSLCYSKSRINAYKALASPSLISLSSRDPILSAFELSWELRRLSRIENEFKDDYEKLSLSCQEYAAALLAETRTSRELEIVLNHDHVNLSLSNNHNKSSSMITHKSDNSNNNDDDNDNAQENYYETNRIMNLSRLKLAIKYKQKKFVSHSHCQQLLVSLWYEGLPGFRRRNLFLKLLIICLISLCFPFLCIMYLLMPKSKLGQIIRQPFIKFICHSASYVLFLFLLILASQRIKSVINDSSTNDSDAHDHHVFGDNHSSSHDKSIKGEKRGPGPTSIELMIIIYVLGFIWAEMKQLYQEGIEEYLSNWWNLLDFITNALYIMTIVLRLTAFLMVKAELDTKQETALFSREKWDPWDPTLISEGLFAVANIFSSLKLVYIFTINPHLGPLQISLGRMVFDIMKFATLILLVVFSFACGLNQLYWYYANMKEQECEDLQRQGELNNEDIEDCYLKIKYFSNLFETLQTLFWGTFGLIEKDRLEIHRKHVFTMFLGLLMFGTYCVIMIIILINMLIAMMSNSYQIIADQSDEEWKFARAKLWISYFEGGCTLPTPFSLVPSPKSIYYTFKWFYVRFICVQKQKHKQQRWLSIKKIMKSMSEREQRYRCVMKELVKRYIIRQQQRDHNAGVTEDDLNEIKQDISSFRFELLDIFKNNGYKFESSSSRQNGVSKIGRKKGKLNLEKTISKNFFELNSINIFQSINMLKKGDDDCCTNVNETISLNKKAAAAATTTASTTTTNKNTQATLFKLTNKIKKVTQPKLKNIIKKSLVHKNDTVYDDNSILSTNRLVTNTHLVLDEYNKESSFIKCIDECDDDEGKEEEEEEQEVEEELEDDDVLFTERVTEV